MLVYAAAAEPGGSRRSGVGATHSLADPTTTLVMHSHGQRVCVWAACT